MRMIIGRGWALGCLLCAMAVAVGGEKTAPGPAQITFSEDDFRQGPAHKTQEIALVPGQKLVIQLGSNPSTGFSWGEKPANSAPEVIKFEQHERIGPKQARPGAGGSQSWTYEAVKAGTATLNFAYNRPWEGGEKGVWTLKVNIKVQ